MIGLALVLAAQTVPPPPPGYVLDSPPCKDGSAECKPWERDWNSPYYQMPVGPGPHTLMIAIGGQVTRVEYKNGRDCAQARDSVLRQWQAQQPNVIVSGRSAVCIPR